MRKVFKYRKCIRLHSAGSINWTVDTFKMLLVDTNYIFDPRAHEFVAGVSGNEIAHASYARQTLAGLTFADHNDGTLWDANDVVFATLAAAAGNLGGFIIYKFITNDASSPLVCWGEMDPVGVPNDNNLTVQLTSGIYVDTGSGWPA